MATAPNIGPMPHTDEWYAEHDRIITATDVAAILGQSEYSTAYEVAGRKLGLVPKFEGNEHTRRGQRYEDAILGDYSEETGRVLDAPQPLYYHPDMPFLGATPDAVWSDGEGLTEAKFSMSRKRADQLGDAGSDEVPSDWLLQTQTQMMVAQVDVCDVAVLLFGRLRIYRVEANQKLFGVIETAVGDFWAKLATGKLPDPDWNHPATPDAVKAMRRMSAGVELTLAVEHEGLWERYRRLGQEITEKETERKLLKAQVQHAMGDAEIGTLPGLGVELYYSETKVAEKLRKAYSFTTLRQRKLKT